MAIVYVHGVANRGGGADEGDARKKAKYEAGIQQIRLLIARYVAPAAGTSVIEFAYWGDKGVTFRWNLASRPRTRLLGQGAEGAEASSIYDQPLMLASIDVS